MSAPSRLSTWTAHYFSSLSKRARTPSAHINPGRIALANVQHDQMLIAPVKAKDRKLGFQGLWFALRVEFPSSYLRVNAWRSPSHGGADRNKSFSIETAAVARVALLRGRGSKHDCIHPRLLGGRVSRSLGFVRALAADSDANLLLHPYF